MRQAHLASSCWAAGLRSSSIRWRCSLSELGREATREREAGAAAVEIGIFASNGTFGFPSVNTGGFDNLSLDVNVPEPGTLVVFAGALIVFGVTRRYKFST